MPVGKSLALSQNSFVEPPTREFELEESASPTHARLKRQANLYDAVAGRVNAHGFIPSFPHASKYRDTASSNRCPVRPEEVLFRRQNAPDRYEETDFYFAHESLSSDRPLPSSDLLEALHAYAADFYDSAVPDRGRLDIQSLDETALLATGILLEEMAKESLGETGDMVLVEGEEVLSDDDLPPARLRTLRRKRSRSRVGSILPSSGDDLDSVVRRRRSKKRRLVREASTTDFEPEGARI
ncbi:uncharacterized protein BDW47DRAFT_32588 [Aspergillus candidus]|uniref:Uncharacterized protein n=1 Tax=Aspergillus candidus TaxID=41067 RepID=A0A2I2FB93_ASPCN|nr:hypothetical protein BDW47DRAFT_32588 [Aspergillus candidus]PLB37900.1 hypothetical protein BDW47DRAFT_32588 [Aspergillus candidus]